MKTLLVAAALSVFIGAASSDGGTATEPSFSMAPTFLRTAPPKPPMQAPSPATTEPSFSMGPSRPVDTSQPEDPCGERQICEYFHSTPKGETVKHGDYVSDEWHAIGFSITASSNNGGYTPGGRARIMDTAHPGSDKDLGSPNKRCPAGGPGEGDGGVPGAEGENCQYEGNVLIIQEERDRDVDDNAYGGSIKFTFTKAVFVVSLGIMDLDVGESADLQFDYHGGNESSLQPLHGLGDNSIQDIIIEKDDVKSMTYRIDHSGAIRYVCYCDTEWPARPPPPPPKPPVPFGEICIYFDRDAYGQKLRHGDYISDKWLGFGLNITVTPGEGGYAPGGQARIMDTATPGLDKDLGSPNRSCPGGGPGEGIGGERFMTGENCQYEGNVLIIQEEKDRDVDDNAYGGSIKFSFSYAASLEKMGLMDLDRGNCASFDVTKSDGSVKPTVPIYGLGDNSVQQLALWGMRDVASIELNLFMSGAVRYFCYSLDPTSPIHH